MFQSASYWVCLLIAIPIYWLLPERVRAFCLAAASFAFLVTVDLTSVLWLTGWTIAFFYLTHFSLPFLSGARRVVLLVLAVLAALGAYKYLGPLLSSLFGDTPGLNLMIPLGISYYTFKLIHYAVECARGNIEDRSLARFSCYLFFVPIFAAGPIERYEHFYGQRATRWDKQLAIEGLTRIAHGLVKKGVIITLALTPLFGHIDSVPLLLENLDNLPPYRVLYFVLLSFVISYLDFSAYSDIAIGCSRLFGFRIAENFNFPFFAKDLTDFWRRWHMTLVAWLQAYVYMLLVGYSRNVYVAIFGTFICIGLWHAGTLNWLCWGLFHASGVVLQSRWTRYRKKRKWPFFNSKAWAVVCMPLTFGTAGLGYVFVVTNGLGFATTLEVLGAMLGLG